MKDSEGTTSYEILLNRHYAWVGENLFNMIQRKAALLVPLLERLDTGRGLEVLDVGCGAGLFEKVLQHEPRIRRLTAADPHLDALIVPAAGWDSKVRFLKTPGAQLPFESETFDLSFTASTLHHVAISGRDLFLSEIRRVTRRGGLIVIFEHNPWNFLTQFFVGICPLDRGTRLLPAPALISLVREAGLRVLAVKHLIFFPTWCGPLCRQERYLEKLPLGAQYCVIAARSEDYKGPG